MNGTTALGAALLGAACTLAITALVGWPRAAAAGGEADGPRARDDAAPHASSGREAARLGALAEPAEPIDLTPVLSRLTAIETRLDALAAHAATVRAEPRTETAGIDPAGRLAALAQQLQRVVVAVEELASVHRRAPAAPAAIELTAATVLEALERIECARLEPLADEALLFEAEQCSARIDLHGARRRLEVLLARSLPIERRARATIQLAIVHRQFRSESGLAKSAELLQAVWDDATVDGRTRVEAAQQLVWTCEARQQPEQARRWADAVLRERSTVDGTPVPALGTSGENGR